MNYFCLKKFVLFNILFFRKVSKNFSWEVTCLKQNVYEIEKNVEKILRGGTTGFLTLSVYQEVRKKLKMKDYKIFSPYEEAEKVILYTNLVPRVRLYQIHCYEGDQLKHSAILGSLFGLHISNEMFGDIVFYQGNFYVYLLEEISNFVLENFMLVGRIPIKLQEVSLDFLMNYQRKYEKLEVIVTSVRIDAVIAKIIGCNRDKVQDKIRDKLVFLNGKILQKVSYIMKEGDIFSIRGFGKYRYREFVGKTKKGNLVILIDKYVSS